MQGDFESFGAGCDVDVLIVGAGLSGVGMASQLSIQLPSVSYLVVESRSDLGGTWDLFRYPGVRSDSDMYTLGYGFRPWPHATAIADGPAILAYIRETAEAYGVTDHIRYQTRVLAADWSSAESLWTVQLTGPTGASTVTCRFLFAATGYYDYASGYSPEFRDSELFEGTIVHPQFWPAELDYDGARIIVVGSGATAVTLVPALAERAAHVTMLQRTPTYIAALPRRDRLAAAARRVLPENQAHRLIRAKNIATSVLNYQLARRAPKVMAFSAEIRRQVPPSCGLPNCRALQPAVRAVGSAALSGPGRRLLRRDRNRSGRRRDRHHRCLHPYWNTPRNRDANSQPTSSSPPPDSTCSSWAG